MIISRWEYFEEILFPGEEGGGVKVMGVEIVDNFHCLAMERFMPE